MKPLYKLICCKVRKKLYSRILIICLALFLAKFCVSFWFSQEETDVPKRGYCIRQITEGNISANESVTLVTQGSIGYFLDFVNLSKSWNGPLSVTFYINQSIQYSALVASLDLWRKCEPAELSLKTSITVFHPTKRDFCPKLRTLEWFSPNLQCENYTKAIDYLLKHNPNVLMREVPDYPINTARNLGRKMVRTKYELVVDMEMVPAYHLNKKLELFLQENPVEDKEVFVIPAFEITRNISVPISRRKLKRLKQNGEVFPFHQSQAYECHRNPFMSDWWRGNEKLISILGSTSWRPPCWEPIYVSRTNLPAYDESFRGYSMNKVQLAYELCRAGYTFRILSTAFFVHYDDDETAEKEKTIVERNEAIFRGFQRQLDFVYGSETRDKCDRKPE